MCFYLFNWYIVDKFHLLSVLEALGSRDRVA